MPPHHVAHLALALLAAASISTTGGPANAKSKPSRGEFQCMALTCKPISKPPSAKPLPCQSSTGTSRDCRRPRA